MANRTANRTCERTAVRGNGKLSTKPIAVLVVEVYYFQSWRNRPISELSLLLVVRARATAWASNTTPGPMSRETTLAKIDCRLAT